MNRVRVFAPGDSRPDPVLVAEQNARPRTALAVRRGEAQHLAAHLARLEAAARAMGEPAGWVRDLASSLEAWLSAEAIEDAALRLRLHPGQLEARLEHLPSAPQPYRLIVRPHPMGARRGDPLLVHKGLSGPWGRDLLAEAHRLGAEDVLLIWPDGTLAETAIAAIGVELGESLQVPLPRGRVASLAERLDLPAWAAARGLRRIEAPVALEAALSGRLWCMNALRGIWPSTIL
ncbi:MAG TPA: aminotransferase class IV [Geothrix sp.]|nr:aminotransferase class IV [Geothrix sp.]